MTRRTPSENTLYYGDNLDILRNDIEDESIDLIYLDPPFNSNATYNVLFQAPTGESSPSQIEAFGDTWHWTDTAERAYDEVVNGPNSDASAILIALRSFLKENDMMAYLVMMALRLLELHRVLKPNGSMYLHCDPTASHYLKLVIDAVFGKKNMGAELIWKRTSAHSDSKQGRMSYGRIHDTIFYYSKSDKITWNQSYTEYDETYISNFYKYIEEGTGRRYRLGDLTGPGGAKKGNPSYEVMGVTRYWRYSKERMQELIDQGRVIQTRPGGVPAYKRYLDEMKGVELQDIWSDIPPLSSQSKERLGYPTQKPVALLERIIGVSSNEGDLVLDPFCGCGTTVHAAQKLNRRWLGIDITHLAIGLIQRRLNDAFPGDRFSIRGVPKDIGGARSLAATDKHEFQLWALSLVEAQPFKGGQKGADRGVDGYLYFKPDGKRTEKAIVSVKGGATVNDAMVKDLITTVEHEGAGIGVFITLTPPTRPMIARAAAAGFYKTEWREYPKIQILTIEGLFEGKRPDLPWLDPSAFRKAAREETSRQDELDL
ncbi:MAG TPA: DNA methyltransferase [Hyphomicrobiales bacterium]